MKPHIKFAAFIAAMGCSALSTSAATFYWDDGTVTVDGVSGGGTGSWTIGAGGWENGTSIQNWADGNAAVFGGTAGTVTLGGAISASSATFNTAGYIIDTAGFNLALTGGTTGSASTILLSGGSKLTAGNGITVNSAITLGSGGGNLSGGTGNYGIFTGKISGGTAGTTSLTINSGHTQLDNTANDFLGNISVSSYYLKTAKSDVIPDAAEITIGTGGGLKFQPTAAGNYTETIAALNGGGYQTWAEGTGVNFNLRVGYGGANSNYSSAISQFGGAVLGLTKIGAGTMTLNAGSDYSGGTTLSAGTIVANAGNALSTSGTVTLNDAATGSSNTSLLLGNATITRNITIANQGSGITTLGSNGAVALPTFSGVITLAKDVTLDGSTNTDRLTFTGGIGGSGNVTIAGTGRVAFNSTTNTFAGNVTVNSGAILQLGDTDDTVSLIPDTSIVTNNGTIKLTKGNLRSETIGGLAGSGTVRSHEGVGSTASTLIIDMASGTQTFSGILENGGASGSTVLLTKSGAGTQIIAGSAANTYTGLTTVNGGTLTLDKNDGVTAIAGNVLVTGTGTLATSANKSGRIADSSNITIDGSGASFQFGLNQNDTINTLAVNNGGTVSIGAGGSNLRPNGGITSSGGGSITMVAGGAGLNFNGATRTVSVSDNTLTISAPISSGGLTKSGNGTLGLSAANTYTGTTTINGGKLALTGSGSLASAAIIIGANTTFDVSGVTGGYTSGAGQTISGTGTIVGNITVGGTLAPGNSPGDLVFADNLGLTNTLVLEITGITSGMFDRLAGDGANTLTLGGILSLNNTGYTPTLNDTVTVFSNWQNITGSFTTITGTDLGGGLSWDASQLSTTGVLTVVPEPGAALFGGIGLIMLLGRRRPQ